VDWADSAVKGGCVQVQLLIEVVSAVAKVRSRVNGTHTQGGKVRVDLLLALAAKLCERQIVSALLDFEARSHRLRTTLLNLKQGTDTGAAVLALGLLGKCLSEAVLTRWGRVFLSRSLIDDFEPLKFVWLKMLERDQRLPCWLHKNQRQCRIFLKERGTYIRKSVLTLCSFSGLEDFPRTAQLNFRWRERRIIVILFWAVAGDPLKEEDGRSIASLRKP